MKFKHVLLLTLSLVILSFGLPNNIQKKIDKEIKNVFNLETYVLEPRLFSEEVKNAIPSYFGKTNFFEIKTSDSLIGYAYVSKAPSKTDQFDYVVLFDSELIIVKSKVLIYREDYGGEIGSKRWLKQFIGKSKDDKVKEGENIAAISGATISVRSMTKAINDLLTSIKILIKANEL